MSNHLFIGLGGTGCAVVREFKKRLFADWRGRGGTGQAPDIYEFKDHIGGERHEVRIGTLGVDSSDYELNRHLDKWRVLGEQLELRPNEKVRLFIPPNLDNVPVNDCAQDPQLNLRRRPLAIGNNLQELLTAFNERRNALSAGRDPDVCIHIACSLAGSTGGGVLVDTIAQLRRVLANEQGNFPIYLYLFATAADVRHVDCGYFHSNQYAVLQELNALDTGIYQPWDISGSNDKRRLYVRHPFESAFIFTDTAGNGVTWTFDAQVRMAAEFAFQNLARLMDNMPFHLVRAYDPGLQYDCIINNKRPETRFAAVGISRLAIPEQEIHEKLANALVSQAMNCLLYRTWDSRKLYEAVPMEFNADYFVERRKEAWGMTRDQLNLDVCHPSQAPDLPPRYLEDWEMASDKDASDLMVTYSKESRLWIAELDARLEKYWHHGFRGEGVEAYFRVRCEESALIKRARHLVEQIEQELLSGMEILNDEYQAHQFPKIVRCAKSHLEAEAKNFRQYIMDLPLHIQRLMEVAEACVALYQKAGFFGRKIGKHKTIFYSYVKARQDYHYLETCLRAAKYALNLIDCIIPELDCLEHRVSDFVHMLEAIGREHKVVFREPIVQTSDQPMGVIIQGRDESTAGATRDVIPYVDDREVNESIECLLRDPEIQRENAMNVAELMRSLRGEGGFETYTILVAHDDHGCIRGTLVEKIRRGCFEYAMRAHEKRRSWDPSFVPILGCNIIDKIYHHSGGLDKGALTHKLCPLIKAASPMAVFDTIDIERYGSGLIFLRGTILVPECLRGEGSCQFRKDLVDRMQTMIIPCGETIRWIHSTIVDIPEERNHSEIAVLATACSFPLGLLRTVQGLHKRHSGRLAHDGEAVAARIYSEIHRPPLPNLVFA